MKKIQSTEVHSSGKGSSRSSEYHRSNATDDLPYAHPSTSNVISRHQPDIATEKINADDRKLHETNTLPRRSLKPSKTISYNTPTNKEVSRIVFCKITS